MEKLIELIKHLIKLFTFIIYSRPGLVFIFIGTISLCCILTCRAKTIKAIWLPAAITIALSILSFGTLYYIFKLTVGV